MIDKLPIAFNISFIAITTAVLLFLYKTSKGNKLILASLIFGLFMQGIAGYYEFYIDSIKKLTFHILFLFLPPFVPICIYLFTPRGKKMLKGFELKWLTLMQSLRLPIAFILAGLYFYKLVPQSITFLGLNFDILAGLSAPAIFYYGYQKKTLSIYMMILWNILALYSLIQLFVVVLFALPSPFQTFIYKQSASGILYFPYVWLFGFITPSFMFGHLAAISHLFKTGNEYGFDHSLKHVIS
ncbi:hypothetical protein OO013_04995 [Mangrovivirga sp. M17]|uniref:Lycopene cyclase domain-containing protein n=1 Tax=Mangrovivirga halotolerans TaxID=2993936 RepID=A0ABT3RN60_9BACT|nr:hypothetical protein [Mangrovivirga halotolerans]MCX2743209.1 hypothetical protein [Mangrovivirga halotolerans]